METDQEQEQKRALITEAIKTKNVGGLVEYFFKVNLTPKQVEIVRTIAFSQTKRACICCMTRYGKSFCVAIGVLLYILRNEHKRILLIAPLNDQTKIIRNYISHFIIESADFRALVDIQLTGLDKLKSEVSKTRITFKNNCELMTLSAEGEGTRLMGWGGDLIICDEDCLINAEVYRAKISRMLGDNPDSIMVSIGNPWNRNNQMYEHWTDPKYKHIHIDWKTALKEKRITQEFVEEQRHLLTPMEFEILYNAKFPEEAADSVFNLGKVRAAEEKVFTWEGMPKERKIISCDVADKGIDRTVIMSGKESNSCYIIEDIYSEATSDNMGIAARIIKMYREGGADQINIDTIGVGVGVVSRVKEVLMNEKVRVLACHYGEGIETIKGVTDKSDSNKKRFINKKAEQFFRLRDLFNEGRVSIPKHTQLVNELMKMTWDMTSGEKIKIIDPDDKSPDFADALVYFIWKTKKEIILNFG